MNRVLTSATTEKVGEQVLVKGWVNSRRDHGGLIFIDLRDHSGVAQLVIQPEAEKAFKLAEQLRDEFVVSATGSVREREEGLKNPNLATGNIEIKVDDLTILNRSEPLPIQLHNEETQSNEDLRLKYRYLDLRRPKMQDRLRQRAAYYKVIRDYMEAQDFTEVTTPILANSSPEGARDFLVPSRVHPGKFYALPQAPQQFKQLLMVGGVSRYYQIATCFRDEDPRADRLYGDFYQLDLEMAFVESGEEVRSTMDPLVRQLVTDFAGKKLLNDDIPCIPYTEAMEKYGSDKPDLRFGMELVELSEELEGTELGVFKNADCVKAICVKGASSLSRSQIDNFTEIAKSEGAGGLAYVAFEQHEKREDGATYVLGGDAIENDLRSPILKFLSFSEKKAILEKVGAEPGDTIFFGADMRAVVNKVLGRLRNEFADHFGLKDPGVVATAWIVDFPFYEWDDKANKLDFGHNPFSMPKGGTEVLEAAQSDEERLNIVADQYDLVMNGYEVCSGAVRNHNPEVMYKVFGILGYEKAYVEDKFGAMLGAFKYGAPPHAGCAFGVDRMFMVLVGEDNIREVVAFPRNGSGVDAMMNSPSAVEEAQLKELSIETTEEE